MAIDSSSDAAQTAFVEPLRPSRKMGEAENSASFSLVEGGGVTAARGFRAAGVHAGFRKHAERLDFALIAAEEPCSCAAVFTKNIFCSAPVVVSREYLGADAGAPACGTARAVMINSGNANAATGSHGLEVAHASAGLAAEVLGCTQDEVMVASTGVIGEHLPLEPFRHGLPNVAQRLSREGGADAARAIMTTDTLPKEAAVVFEGAAIGYPDCTFTVGGMAKGSGMIMPNMATMLAVITTDAPLLPNVLHVALARAVDTTFNKVTVDSDTSTNDSCYLLASGAAAPRNATPFALETPAFAAFEKALGSVCENLARQIAADGEGATRLITVHVSGAATPNDADRAAREVANSPLVKTAIYGHDANWGRIAMAIGKSGAAFRQEDAAIDIMGLPVCRKGLTVAFDEEEALKRFESSEIVIDIDLGAGTAQTTVWTCDFSHEYVTINGDYRS